MKTEVWSLTPEDAVEDALLIIQRKKFGALPVLDGDRLVQLTPRAGRLVATLDVERDGHYRVELPAADGRMLVASPEYAIEVLADGRPEVAVKQPGRDIDVASVEEVVFRVRAVDDGP